MRHLSKSEYLAAAALGDVLIPAADRVIDSREIARNVDTFLADLGAGPLEGHPAPLDFDMRKPCNYELLRSMAIAA